MKRLKTCILSFILVSIIAFNSYESKVYADAGTITVAGGSIAIGGLGSLGAGTALAPYVVPIVLGVMVACGLNVYITEQSQQAGMTKSQYVKTKIAEYCDEIGVPIDNFWNNFANNVSIAESGAIYLGSKARTQIKQFVNWLQSQNKIQNVSSADSLNWNGETLTIEGRTFPLMGSGDTINVGNGYTFTVNSIDNNKKVGLLAKYTAGHIELFAFQQNQTMPTLNITIPFEGYTGGFSLSFEYNNVWHNKNTYPIDLTQLNPSIPYIDNSSTDLVWETFPPLTMDNPENDTFTGTNDNVGNLNNVLSPSGGNTTVYNPDLTSGIDYTGLNNLTVSLREYLDALENLLNGARDIPIDATDDKTGEKVRENVDADEVDPTIAQEDEEDMPAEDDMTPISNDNPADPTEDPIATTAPLKFDLRNIFPFCIPFDVKDMISLLQAEPVAPVYTVNWNIPIINQNLSFTVDLNSFNSVAATCRKMELLIFIIGLAVATRSLFIRG